MGRKVGAYGPQSARVMIVGEAPGAYEEREGKPFVGPAGQLLREVLMQSGINPDQVFYTNICRFRPPGNDIKQWFLGDGLPGPEVVAGLAELKEEIEAVKPNVIIPVGSYPMKMITREGRWNRKEATYTGIGDYRGSILESKNLVPGIKCIPTYHPANILRNYPNKAIMRLDLTRAAEQMAFPEIRRPEYNFALNPQGEERQAWRDRLLSDPNATLSFDIEYIGTNLLCLGMSTNTTDAVVIQTKSKADVDFVRDIVCSGIKLCAQNAMFDCSILEWFYGFDVLRHLKFDTMIASHAAYIEFPKDLGFLTSVYTEQPFYKDMISWEAVRNGSQPITDVLHYNALDVVCTHKIMEEQSKEELTDNHVRNTFEHEMALIPALWRLSKLGCRIDVDHLTTLRNTLETEAATLLAGLRALTGQSGINVKSGPQVAKLLFKDLGLPTGRMTPPSKKFPRGQPKTDDDTLADLLLKAPDDRSKKVITVIRKARERIDLISKFCDIELDDDGRMRCHYDPAKTDTGRLSSRKFYPTGRGANLQNVPRDNRVRSVFIPDPGYTFGYADLMQAESLVVSHLSQDPEMLRLHLTPGLDGHRYVAAYLFDKAYDEVNKDERFIGKKVRHACNYLLGWHRLMLIINAEAQETGVSITAAEAKVYVDKYRALHKFLTIWWREVEAELRTTRTLYTLMGRKRVFYDRIDSILPNAVAYIPQGTVGDVLNVGLLNCDRSYELNFLGYQPLLQVHDAIGYQYPSENEVEVNKLIRQLLRVDLTVPKTQEPFHIPVEIKTGGNWGEFDPKKPEENPNGLVIWEQDLAA